MVARRRGAPRATAPHRPPPGGPAHSGGPDIIGTSSDRIESNSGGPDIIGTVPDRIESNCGGPDRIGSNRDGPDKSVFIPIMYCAFYGKFRSYTLIYGIYSTRSTVVALELRAS